MSTNIKKSLRALALGAAATLATAGASFALTAGNITDGSDGTVGDKNSGVVDIYGSSPQAGWYGVTGINVAQQQDVLVVLLGKEASWNNIFKINGTGGSSLTFTGNDVAGSQYNSNSFCIDLTDCKSGVINVAAGNLDFVFTSQGGGSASNASNPEGDTANFFTTYNFAEGWVDLWFDDNAIVDDNHDDLAIRIYFGDGDFNVPVPLPAGVWLMGTALAGLGVASRRRRKA